LLAIGAVVASALVVAWSLVESPVVLFVVWIGLGACMALLFYEPAFTILTKRLRGAARHRAVTQVTLVAGLASTIFGPLTAVLEDWLGWRGAVAVLAVVLGVVTVPLFVIALRPPTDVPELVLEHSDMLPRDAMATMQFWLLTIAYLLSAFTTYAIAVHLVPYLRSNGWESGHAALALGSVGLVQVLGRSGFTRLTARRSAGPLGTWVLASKGIGIAALIVSPTIAGVVVFLVFYGAANGLQTLTRATVIADLYGVAHYGSISAVVSSVSAVAGSTAPFVLSGAIELVGRDEPVLWSLVVLAIASAATNQLAVARSHH
jgi:MFS family permease